MTVEADLELADMTYSIRGLAFGAQHAAAVGHTGVVLTWGNSECGVLGQVRQATLVLHAMFASSVGHASAGALSQLQDTGRGGEEDGA